MPRAIDVFAGARLHFGPLASGVRSGRCFGGIGLMIDAPAIQFRVEAADHESYEGCSTDTSTRLERLRACWSSQTGEQPRRWLFQSEPRSHCGFGTGTQLSLAVSAALALWRSEQIPAIQTMALACGRGARSAIGIHGFLNGGFLVDAGQTHPAQVGELAVRQEVPASWRFVMIEPIVSQPGLSGQKEKQAFEALSPMPDLLTSRLCRLTLMEILPALKSGDCRGFEAALSQYGRLIGEYFQPVQGGVFASPAVRDLAAIWPSLGKRLVQSSWGPAVTLIYSDEKEAERLREEFADRGLLPSWRFTIARPLNHGARFVVDGIEIS